MSQRTIALTHTHKNTVASTLLPLGMLLAAVTLPAFAQSTPPGKAAGPDVIVGPVPLPNPHVPGYAYPESEKTILDHVNRNDQPWISTHAWGLWTALTRQVLPNLHVYETWQSPFNGEVLASGLNSGGATQFVGSDGQSTTIHRLGRPGQFHGHHFVETAAAALPSISDQVLVTVNWSPQMANEVVEKNWLSSTTLNQLLSSGQKGITLNNYSVSLKPTYLWMGAPLLVQGRYFQLSTWPGPIKGPIAFPSNLWGQCVWVDTQESGAGTGTGAVDTSCKPDGSSRTAANTYGMDNFINFKLTAMEAKLWAEQGINVQVNGKTYQPAAGEKVILIAMHVGTREMTEWTWQSYWWQPNPKQVLPPATQADVAARPAQLKGAPAHYAMCSAYQMVAPNQPITGGSGTKPHLCYNPYLEAPFSHEQDLPGSQPWTYQGVTYDMKVGVQTNCMSCHLQATYQPTYKSGSKVQTGVGTLPYTADRYIDLNSKDSQGYLQMDFSWSIQQNVKIVTSEPPTKAADGAH